VVAADEPDIDLSTLTMTHRWFIATMVDDGKTSSYTDAYTIRQRLLERLLTILCISAWNDNIRHGSCTRGSTQEVAHP
jgi:hypothetical protein